MPYLLLIGLLSVAVTAGAKDLACSVKASRFDAETKSMAKVTERDARKTAMSEVRISGASISSGGLEVEDGCLLYTYDIKVPSRKGVQEVIIDAGTGKVLNVEHESPAKEAAERAHDKVNTKR